jgi:hypothetical protein
LLIALTLTTSCFCDDTPNTTSVQYRINVEHPVITEVFYRQADGNIISENTSLEDKTIWHTTEYVRTPFETYQSTIFLNNSKETVEYKLSLFVNGKLARTKEGTILQGVREIAEIKYSF